MIIPRAKTPLDIPVPRPGHDLPVHGQRSTTAHDLLPSGTTEPNKATEHQTPNNVQQCPKCMCEGLSFSRAPKHEHMHLSCMYVRRARSRRCGVDMSVCRCRIVLVSCLCRIMELCSGVCIVGVRARVLARACARVLRRRRPTSLLTLETARPFPSCRTTGPRGERGGTRHAVHCSRKKIAIIQYT